VVPLEGSLVEITLDATDGGTRLHLVHRVADEAAAKAHRTGWRYQLGLFRSLLSRDVLGRGLAGRIDRWHDVWGVTDAAERRRTLEEIATPDLVVDESMAALTGIDDLDEWIAQSQAQFTATVRRTGDPAVSAERATWDWEVVAGDATIATGRSTADLGADGRFRRITSFWLNAPPGFPTSVVPGL
jgi:hypothetical protein